ncbi:hypothetical protein [Psychromarinibacter halotolerans]|uniref:Uncharacterized protein n=1 Tax=Psychromarinibacter halotolerans TaxID=1775175 RepID=A0ABV7GZD0_9RHOB|nr:hypothetical protein [Psychromarinibacter halotolerans]MDF0596396.1 hypothetical protein [Psychromarinibacter halotolerans]
MTGKSKPLWPLGVLLGLLVAYLVLPQILPDEVLLYVLVVPVMLGLAFITARLTRFRYGGFLPGSMRNWFLEREARRDE